MSKTKLDKIKEETRANLEKEHGPLSDEQWQEIVETLEIAARLLYDEYQNKKREELNTKE